MAVYVDDMKAKYGRMVMSHMIADSEEELQQMATRIGVALRWHQYPGTYKSHFDICQQKRELALAQGAVPITYRELGIKIRERRIQQSRGA